MTETELSVEQRIAQFLESNDITIVPENFGQQEQLHFVQHLPDRSMRDLGSLMYDTTTGTSEPTDPSNMLASLQLKGFATTVRRPLVRILQQVKGDFYADCLQPIHDALDRLEAKYQQIPSPPK
ncbi:hypothetical protein J4208_03430 [Candidatus Woesearchaeota archaeon]|nr:hypothetical protein [Candidatus Woesearchaeota archaeon]